jgi:hypothetical protein
VVPNIDFQENWLREEIEWSGCQKQEQSLPEIVQGSKNSPMEVETRIDPDTGMRQHAVTGDLTFDGLMSALAGIYADPAFRPEQNSLWDLRETRATEISVTDLRRIVDLVRENWGTTGAPKSALVVSSDLDFGMGRMYEAFLDSDMGSQVRVFRDIDEARNWIED